MEKSEKFPRAPLLEPAKYRPPPTIANNNNKQQQCQFTAGSGRLSELASSKLSRAKLLELSVLDLVGLSAEAGQLRQPELALERAREALESLKSLQLELASRNQKELANFRRPATSAPNGLQLKLMVEGNLGAQMEACGLFREALELYTGLCRLGKPGSQTDSFGSPSSLQSKQAGQQQMELAVGGQQQFQQSLLLHKFGLNIGNVYYRLNDFKRALKYYRLTLDRLSSIANLSGPVASPRAGGREKEVEEEEEEEEEEGKKEEEAKQQLYCEGSRQLKLKLMNNISLALAKQHKARKQLTNKTNNERGGGHNHQETITSLKLLLADNLDTMSRPKRRLEQQVAACPEEAAAFCWNANHHAFGLNLIASLIQIEQEEEEEVAGELTGALKALVKVDICNHFQRVLRTYANFNSSQQPFELNYLEKDIVLKQEKVELAKLLIQELANDELERVIEQRQLQTTRNLLLAFQLARKFLRGERLEQMLAGSASYAHLTHELKLADALATSGKQQNKLNKLVSIMRQLEESIELDWPEVTRTTPGLLSACFLINLSKSFSDKSKLERAEQLASRCHLYKQINLANCQLVRGNFDKAQEIYRKLELTEDNKNKPIIRNYNLAIAERLAASSISVLPELLSATGSSDSGKLSQKNNCLQLSQMQAILAACQNRTDNSAEDDEANQQEPFPAAPLKLLGELVSSGGQAPEVYLLASRLASSELKSLSINKSSGEPAGRAALGLLQQANREHPYHLPVLERLIALSISSFDYKRARLLIKSCIKNRPDQVRWYQMLAECYRREADYEQAAQIYRLAIERFPQDTSCLKALIKLTEELGLDSQRRLYEEKLARLLSAVR